MTLAYGPPGRGVHSPLLVIRIAVTVVLGVCAASLDAARALLNPGPGAAPVVVLLVGLADPPGVRTSIYEKRKRHSQVDEARPL